MKQLTGLIFFIYLWFLTVSSAFGQVLGDSLSQKKGGGISITPTEAPKDSLSLKKGDGSTPTKPKSETAAKDSISPRKEKNPLKRGEVNFIINRAFSGASSMSDSVPISGVNSGSLFVGVGYNFNLNNKFALHIQPGINFFKIRYKNTTNAAFPAYNDTTATLSYKRQMLTYAEVPIGVVYTFKRDEKKSKVTYVEAGVFGGIQVAERLRLKYRVPDNYSLLGNHTEIKKIRNMGYMNPFRYGVYARVGQGFLSFYAAFRLSNVFFNHRRQITDGLIQLYPNPKLFGLEFGFGIVL